MRSISRVPVAWTTAPAPRKSRRLEQRVVPDVQQAPAKPSRTQSARPVRAADQRQAQPQQDDADVLDAAVGEQPFEVALAEREGDAEHAAEARRAPAPAPPRRRSGPAAAPRSRARARRCPILSMTPDITADTWLGAAACAAGQPEVQRHRPRLDAEAEAPRARRAAEWRSRARLARGQRAQRAHVAARRASTANSRRSASVPTCVRRGRSSPAPRTSADRRFGGDEQVGRDRHDLPGDQEELAPSRAITTNSIAASSSP